MPLVLKHSIFFSDCEVFLRNLYFHFVIPRVCAKQRLRYTALGTFLLFFSWLQRKLVHTFFKIGNFYPRCHTQYLRVPCDSHVNQPCLSPRALTFRPLSRRHHVFSEQELNLIWIIIWAKILRIF